MGSIQMVDLLGQYEKMREEIDEAILNVVRSGAYINGPDVRAFQEELESYLNVEHVVPCANGTDALQIALMACGIGPGDEVITPDFTYVATAEVIALLGARPVFVDVDPDSFLLDPQKLEEAISERTRAVIPVHLYGQCCDMERIMEIARKENLWVIEDLAQALGTAWYDGKGVARKAGTTGHIGCTSFFPSKNLGAFGDGGAMMTRDDGIASLLRSISSHGQEKKYHHERVGVNSRLDSIQAAILRVKLEHLDEHIEARRWAASRYDEELGELNGLQCPVRVNHSDHGFHQYTVRLKKELDRDGVRSALQEKGIPSVIYYPLPLHAQGAFKPIGKAADELKNSKELCREVLSLPIHTELDQEQIEQVASALNECLADQEIQSTP